MDETTALLRYIQSNNKVGEFKDIEWYLTSRGHNSFASRNRVVKDMNNIGYILSNPDKGFDQDAIRHQQSLREGHEDWRVYSTDVQLTAKGEQYLTENETNVASLNTAKEAAIASKKSANAAWFTAAVASISLVFSLSQFYENKVNDRRISKQDSTIAKLASKLAIVSAKEEALSDTLAEMKSLRQNASTPESGRK